MIKKRYVFILCFILLILASFYDLSINQFLYQPHNLFGIIFQRYILIIIVMILPFTTMIFYRLYAKWYYLIINFICCIYTIYMMVRYITKLNSMVFIVGIATVFMAIIYFWIQRISLSRLKEYEQWLWLFVITFVISMILINIVKHFWGRIRFRNLEDMAMFQNWWLPQGISGHKSFPSAHTGMASVILCFISLDQVDKRFRDKRILLEMIAYSFIILMGLSRMMMGAHYLSDVVVGFLITFTIYQIMNYCLFRKGKKI